MSLEVEPAATVDEVIELYVRFGADRYDETVTQLDHGLQCAALARHEGADDSLVAAALLHDVGHLLHLRSGGEGPVPEDLHHEANGARYLGGLFGPEVTAPIALHVRAKRYLAATEPGFVDSLSHGSTLSLVKQGGPLDDDEVRSFEANPGHDHAIRLRRWDDAGKVDGIAVDGFETYESLLRALQRDAIG